MIFYLPVLGMLLLFASACSKTDIPQGNDDSVAVAFYSAISEVTHNDPPLTRASGTEWDAGDRIGIYAVPTGKTWQEAAFLNVDYVNSETGAVGVFQAADAKKAVMLPGDGSKLDFVAYYPYSASAITDFNYALDITDQTDPSRIDVLYAKAEGKDKTTPEIPLIFDHKLAQLVLSFSAADVVLEGMKVTLNNVTTDGWLDLTDGVVTQGTDIGEITPIVTTEAIANTATASAFLLPGQQMTDVTIAVALADGKKYEWKPVEDNVLIGGYSHPYTFTLTSGGVASGGSGTILPIKPGKGGDAGELDPLSFTVDKTTIDLPASNATATMTLTADAGEVWTAVSDQPWLSLSPESGSGSAVITLTATENMDARRTAAVTLTPTASSTLSPVGITVIQAAGTSEPVMGTALFPGSDFEDWGAFTAGLTASLPTYTTQSTEEAYTGTRSLHLNGTPDDDNECVFTAKVPENFVAPSKIVFFIKGKAGKSLSILLHKKADSSDYYNLKTCTADTTLLLAGGDERYDGIIDTGGNWVKVTLNILKPADIDSTAENELISFKVGGGAAYDLWIDDITMEND
ncbi:MAG: fimbrillin family protein [Dysgonamonadaceae bacterium]